MSQWGDDPILRKSLILTFIFMGVIGIFALLNYHYGLYTKVPTSFKEFVESPVTNWNITQFALLASALAIFASINFIKKRLVPWRSSAERRLINMQESLAPHLYPLDETRNDAINDNTRHKTISTKNTDRITRVTILIGVGTLVIGGVSFYNQASQTEIQKTQIEIQKQQADIQKQQIALENYTFVLENFPTKVSIISTNFIQIQSQKYEKYSSPIMLSFSSVSPHYLKLEINKVWVQPTDLCTFQTPPTIFLNGTIEKFIDKGVFNANFEIPAILNSDPRKLSQEQLTDERLASIPIFINATVYDEQNKTEPMVYHQIIISELHMENQYIAKSPCN